MTVKKETKVAAFSSLGGLARAKVLSPERRCEIASMGGRRRAKVLSAKRRCEIASMGGQAKPCKVKVKVPELTDELLRNVVELRRRGWTFAQIGRKLGLTHVRVAKLFQLAFNKGFWEG